MHPCPMERHLYRLLFGWKVLLLCSKHLVICHRTQAIRMLQFIKMMSICSSAETSEEWSIEGVHSVTVMALIVEL
jgi:hypothetical protein